MATPAPRVLPRLPAPWERPAGQVRFLLTVRFQLGMVDREVAAVTGLAPGSVRKLTQRAVEHVRTAAERAARTPAGGKKR